MKWAVLCEKLTTYLGRTKKEKEDDFTDAGKVASAFCKEISALAEQEVLDALKAEGCNVVEVEDLTPWQEACKAVIEENTKGQEDLYQQLLDLAN